MQLQVDGLCRSYQILFTQKYLLVPFLYYYYYFFSQREEPTDRQRTFSPTTIDDRSVPFVTTDNTCSSRRGNLLIQLATRVMLVQVILIPASLYGLASFLSVVRCWTMTGKSRRTRKLSFVLMMMRTLLLSSVVMKKRGASTVQGDCFERATKTRKSLDWMSLH